jgi:DNA invertase Pin-like site-specific DNA recombinase
MRLPWERTRSGLEAARVRGRKGGRPKALSPDKQALTVSLYNAQRHTVAQICKMMGISRPTLYKYVDASTQSTPEYTNRSK